MRQECHAFGLTTLIGAALLLVFAAGEVSARDYAMSGRWQDRRGQVFIPLGFPLSAVPIPGFTPPPSPMRPGYVIHTGLLGFTIFPTFMTGLPNGPHFGKGEVSQTGGMAGATVGASPPTLNIPTNRFHFGGAKKNGQFQGTVPLDGVTLVQITTMFSGNGPAAPAVLKKGFGMDFTWCPDLAKFGACVDLPGTSVLTDPPQGNPNNRRNGRIVYTAGKNKYGGVMQILLAGGGLNTAQYGTFGPPFQAAHFAFGGPAGASAMAQHIGGSYSNMNYVTLKPGYVTQPTMTPTPDGLILFPGSFLTPNGGLTPAPPPTNANVLKIFVGPPGQKKGQFTTNTGFPVTTGTVQVQQTTGTGGGDIFTVKGYDKRTGLGGGAISLVAGGLGKRNTPAAPGGTTYAGYNRVFMTLIGLKVPSMSPAGFAAAGALMLLAAGYAMRRRFE